MTPKLYYLHFTLQLMAVIIIPLQRLYVGSSAQYIVSPAASHCTYTATLAILHRALLNTTPHFSRVSVSNIEYDNSNQ